MSSSSARGRNVEDTYESQNDERLDDLHAKIRTLRGITTDIHSDVERQNLMLDDANDNFNSFGSTLSQTSQRAKQAFGIGTPGGLKTGRIAMTMFSVLAFLWLSNKVFWWWRGDPTTGGDLPA
ncbi:Bet1-like protein [Cylindrobasidium torrendii FP15055 ss-10]|uniref:Bet1-like protein n=1 Tax=Cylindrobasidium torrendii FP15055 ss-10 TaxID=1314674 RepID=A0A0D7B9A1_9AGAR|nr:Bet1-like protein [Cylindrobasidium torrendii FP15055 ss-10]